MTTPREAARASLIRRPTAQVRITNSPAEPRDGVRRLVELGLKAKK
jgi:hypothetical protein